MIIYVTKKLIWQKKVIKNGNYVFKLLAGDTFLLNVDTISTAYFILGFKSD